MGKSFACFVVAANLFVIMLNTELVSSELPSDQVSAMTRIYEIFQNNNAYSFVWANVSKKSNPCSWEGVSCSLDNSSILHTSFTSFSVSTSEFLPFLCNVKTLESIDVSNNQLTSIPDGFFTGCGLNLKLLNFSENELNGDLPNLNMFRVLEKLDLSSNSLSGEISLQLDGLSSLKSLNLRGNKFIGKIPTNLGKLYLLEELVLSTNSFSGELPVEITRYKNLRVIDLSENKLSGSITEEFRELIMLQTLVLSGNLMSGVIPTSLSNITTLKKFAARQNKFSGTIPLGMTSYLMVLDLCYNKLNGTIPFDLLWGKNLQFLDLSFNELEGSIPAIRSTKLARLRLGSNSLNGSIPSGSFRSLAELMYLELDNNSLSGEIPWDLGMCKNLALLNLAYNQLEGSLPPVLGNLTNLQVLSLQFNHLVGEIPPQISQLNKLERLNMNGNHLSGFKNSWVSCLSSLVELQLGSNQLSGPIPNMPVSLQFALNLSYNSFSGAIPVSLFLLSRLEVLDLSNNRLSGYVDPLEMRGLGQLTLLLLSNNNLSGSIPVYPNYVVVDISGNPNLIGPRDPTPSPSPGPPPHRKTKSFDSDVFTIAVASGWPIGFLISIIATLVSRSYDRINGHLSTPNSIHRATINFKKAMEAVADPSNITLKATFSTFYKAVMPSGTTYLVKKVSHSRNIFKFPRHNALVEDLEAFGTLSNPNVMVPVAYVLTPHRAYLFYEFARGNLSDILHGSSASTLDWASRYNVSVGVAQGLASLHECRTGPIVLLDLCSKSILLKSLDEPQISDIELCNLIQPLETASDGYVPPEYAWSKRVTAAGNVYSFGVVLLELVTGKPAVSGETELVKWVLSRTQEQNRWGEILDSRISASETSVGVRNQMVAVLKVALACVSESPDMRPNTITVLQILLRIRVYK